MAGVGANRDGDKGDKAQAVGAPPMVFSAGKKRKKKRAGRLLITITPQLFSLKMQPYTSVTYIPAADAESCRAVMSENLKVSVHIWDKICECMHIYLAEAPPGLMHIHEHAGV